MSAASIIRGLFSMGSLVAAGVCLLQIPRSWDQILDTAAQSPDIWSPDLNACLVVVDAGHGGVDGGTKGYGALEKDLALSISRRLEKQLLNRGMQVLLTRSEDVFIVLEERPALANERNADVLVSIHLNADPVSSRTAGVETYYSSRKRLGSIGAIRQSLDLPAGQGFRDNRSRMLARLIQRRLCEATGANDRGERDRDYRVIMDSECPAVLVECGYLTNEEESRRMQDAAHQEKIATSIAQSIHDFVLATKLNARRGIEMVAAHAAPASPGDQQP